MTTEHVSVPHKVYENLAQIADGKMSYNDMQDLASEAYNILSRATPSAPRVVTDAMTADSINAYHDYLELHPGDDFEAMRAALESFANSLPAAIHPGYVVVPVEPTKEMLAAGSYVLSAPQKLGTAYKAMLAAAPQAEKKG